MFDIRKKIAVRLKACRADKGWTYKETAERLSKVMGSNVIPTRYGNWELAINIPPLDCLIGLGHIFDKPPAYLGALTDDDGNAPETARYSVAATNPVATGVGLVNLADDALAFSAEYLAEAGLERAKIMLVKAPDDSMSTTIEKNDRVLVDLADTRVVRDDLFAIIVSGRLWLRWIRLKLDGSYSIQAEKREHYPDENLSAEALADLHILGRARLIAHTR